MKQKVEIMEALFGCETKNKYKLKNSMGQEIYSAKEDTDCCTRNVCGPIRPFGMTIKDNNDLVRPILFRSTLVNFKFEAKFNLFLKFRYLSATFAPA